MRTHVGRAGVAVAAALLVLLTTPAAGEEAWELTPRDPSAHACPPGAVPVAGFADTAGNRFEPLIDCLSWYRITGGGPQGLPADRYGPELPVTRAQMATFLVRLLDGTMDELEPFDGTNRFTDVEAGSPHLESINRLAAAGIAQGGAGGAPPTAFRPEAHVSRAQMATFLARTTLDGDCGYEGWETWGYFFDEDGSPHEPCIESLAGEGIATGTSPGVYSPDADVTRAQMAAFLMRTMDLFVELQSAVPPNTPFELPDVVGSDEEQARYDLALYDLEVVVREDPAHPPRDDERRVNAQEPPAGALVTRWSTVTLTVGGDPSMVVVPDVVGMQVTEAEAALRAAGLEPEVYLSPPVPGDPPAGTVVSQSPEPGEDAQLGEVVFLIAIDGWSRAPVT